MGTHISIDPNTRTIELLTAPVDGIVELGVADDIYSEAKEDWLTDASLRKLRFPLRGPITAFVRGIQVGPFVFVDNASGWRILPYDANHELALNGDLFPLDEDTPLFTPRAGRTITIFGYLSAKTQTALVSGNAPWNSTELSQIRYRLGIDGTANVPTAEPSLIDAAEIGDAVWSNEAALRLLGLSHENSRLDNIVTDVDGNLTSARLRTYDSRANAEAGGATGLIATYQITATYSGSQLSSYLMVRTA